MTCAVWCWHDARVRASESRIAACRAAQQGKSTEAIRLTADAQRHDHIAEDWQGQVPDWQWADYWQQMREGLHA